MESARLLCFRFGMGGLTNDGDVGAEKGWPDSVTASGSDGTARGKGWLASGRLAPAVFTCKFLVLRGLLFGESDRPNPGRLGEGLDTKLDRNKSWSIPLGVYPLDGWSAIGKVELGDSGEELGDGSVSVESTVEMVVVGDESVDSVRMVVPEFRR